MVLASFFLKNVILFLKISSCLHENILEKYIIFLKNVILYFLLEANTSHLTNKKQKNVLCLFYMGC